GAHRLPDEGRRGNAGEAEPVGDLGGDGRLPRPCSAADQQDDRDVELLQLAVSPQPANRLHALVLAEHLLRQLFEPVEVDRPPPLVQLRLDAERELVRPHRRHAGSHQRPGEEALRVREVALESERQRVLTTLLRHETTASATAASASARSSASRSGSPGRGSTSLSTKTASTPRRAASSATTSIAAALISIRYVSTPAGTRCRSSRNAGRLARFPETNSRSAPCASRRCAPSRACACGCAVVK